MNNFDYTNLVSFGFVDVIGSNYLFNSSFLSIVTKIKDYLTKHLDLLEIKQASINPNSDFLALTNEDQAYFAHYCFDSLFDKSFLRIYLSYNSFLEARGSALALIDLISDFSQNIFALPLIGGILSKKKQEETYALFPNLDEKRPLFKVKILQQASSYRVEAVLETLSILKIIESYKQEKTIFPPYLMPFQINVIFSKKTKMDHYNEANKIITMLKEKGINSLIKPELNFELNQPNPLVALIIKIALNHHLEMKLIRFDEEEMIEVSENNLFEKIKAMLDLLHQNIYKNNLKQILNDTKYAPSMNDLNNFIKIKIVRMNCCLNPNCSNQIKSLDNHKTIIIPFDQSHDLKPCIICNQQTNKEIMLI